MFQYVHADEDRARSATITGSADSTAYPAANLGNGMPAKPAKLTTTSGNWVFDLGTVQQVDVVALIHHNLDAGLSVRIQANSSNAWDAPALDQAITIPPARADGFTTNAVADLTSISARSFRYWRLLVSGTNSVACGIGEVVLGGTLRTLPRGISWGAKRTDRHVIKEQKTSVGTSLRYDLGYIERELTAQTIASAANVAALQAWFQSCRGRLVPTLVISDNTVNDCLYALWAGTDLVATRNAPNGQPVALTFTEAPRGLAL